MPLDPSSSSKQSASGLNSMELTLFSEALENNNVSLALRAVPWQSGKPLTENDYSTFTHATINRYLESTTNPVDGSLQRWLEVAEVGSTSP